MSDVKLNPCCVLECEMIGIRQEVWIKGNKRYLPVCLRHYRDFWMHGQCGFLRLYKTKSEFTSMANEILRARTPTIGTK